MAAVGSPHAAQRREDGASLGAETGGEVLERRVVESREPQSVAGQGFEPAALNPAVDAVAPADGVVGGEVAAGLEIEFGIDEGVGRVEAIGDGGDIGQADGLVVGGGVLQVGRGGIGGEQTAGVGRGGVVHGMAIDRLV